MVAYNFGSLTAALQQAGVRPASEEPRWGQEQIIDALLTFHSTHDRSPMHSEWSAATVEHPVASTVVRRIMERRATGRRSSAQQSRLAA